MRVVQRTTTVAIQGFESVDVFTRRNLDVFSLRDMSMYEICLCLLHLNN